MNTAAGVCAAGTPVAGIRDAGSRHPGRAFILIGMLLLGGLSHSLAGEDEPPPPTPVPVKPQSEFSITVSDNPSTGYSVGLAHVSEGVFLLRTEPQKLPPNAPPGAAGGRTFHFFHWHHERPEQAPEIVFARFQPFDLEHSYREEKYVLDIRRAPPARPLRVTPKKAP